MKLKYYLRGLGIGMLVTALVLILAGNADAKMSDEAVKRRAAELGMVEKDKSVLGDVENAEVSAGDEAAGQPEEEEPLQTIEDEETEPDVTLPENDETLSAENESEPASDTEEDENVPVSDEEKELAEEIEQRAEEVIDRAEEVAENSIPEKTVTLVVRSGDSSVSVARRAAEAGLVQSAADFDVFLCQNGYDKRISVGSYEVKVGASEKEIADIITKSR